MAEFPTLKGSWLDLDLGSGLTTYRRASLIDLYLHANFLWTDRRMYARSDGRTDI